MIKILSLKTGDRIIIAMVLVVSLVIGGSMLINSKPIQEGNIVISIDGEVIEKIPIYAGDEKQRFHRFTFGEDEKLGELEIVGNNVRMLPMSREICPEAICSDTGWISGMFQSIVCMPNRIHVYIET